MEPALVRRATMTDVPAIHRLITHHAELNRMLFRSHADLYEHLRDFLVYDASTGSEPQIIGCAALNLIMRDLAEIKSLAVDQPQIGKGVGRALVEQAIAEARDLGLQRVFALTREVSFFKKLGFGQVPMDSLPHKVWTDCVKCPLQENCDEVAVVFDLRGGPG